MIHFVLGFLFYLLVFFSFGSGIFLSVREFFFRLGNFSFGSGIFLLVREFFYFYMLLLFVGMGFRCFKGSVAGTLTLSLA